jgi:large-conductance mechanosensitive channel
MVSDSGRRLSLAQIVTAASVAVLVGAEVFGLAFATGWAIGGLFELGPVVTYAIEGLLCAGGIFVMVALMRRVIAVERHQT